MCINEIIFLIKFYFFLPAPSEQMLSYKLSITTQDFFYILYRFEERNTTDNEGLVAD